jgi:ribosome recycling factor
MMNIVQQHKEQFDKSIEHLRQEISSLRTGRATPALVEDIPIEAYGTKQPLKAVASISVADAKTIVVDPWDKSLLQTVETGLRNSDVGISPVNDGTVLRLPLPELTTERRQELIKVLHTKLEQARIAVRKIREEVRAQIDKSEKEKEISEDEKFTLQDELDKKIVKEYNDKIKTIGEEKEKEIMTR